MENHYDVKRCFFCGEKWVEKHGADGSFDVVNISEEELEDKGIPYEEETDVCGSERCYRAYMEEFM
ncbi:hypothetical protein [Limosilactobacillus equigenerosi]|uniref:hypothetical protein n=1 Tax=Limosilactobacillus equigenerosi TaxID=417373 RepID=UPI0006D136A4|nr:hypothetical protein [Limosilactobacillus equigenerosi]